MRDPWFTWLEVVYRSRKGRIAFVLTVMNEQRDVGIRHKVVHLLAGWIGGHDNNRG